VKIVVKLPSFLNNMYLRLNFYLKLVCGRVAPKIITDTFHVMYYHSPNTWNKTHWLGTPLLKCPLDLWIFQEIIYELKPDIIIECGTNKGGSASFLATLCDLVKNGRIISIDIEDYEGKPQHDRIQYIIGSSTSNEVVSKVKTQISEDHKVLVILDSDHSKEHVLNELRIYKDLVTKGSYIIVEDSNVNGYPVVYNFGPGPMEAINVFLKENKNFKIDKQREKYYLTFNPNGYLKKIK